MKKCTFITMILVIAILAFTTATMVSAKETNKYNPAETLDSSGMNEEAIEYFKSILAEKLDVNADDCFIGIISKDTNVYIFFYESDENGEMIQGYEIFGDLYTDMLYSIHGWYSEYLGFDYDIEIKDYTIIGTRKDNAS